MARDKMVNVSFDRNKPATMRQSRSLRVSQVVVGSGTLPVRPAQKFHVSQRYISSI